MFTSVLHNNVNVILGFLRRKNSVNALQHNMNSLIVEVADRYMCTEFVKKKIILVFVV